MSNVHTSPSFLCLQELQAPIVLPLTPWVEDLTPVSEMAEFSSGKVQVLDFRISPTLHQIVISSDPYPYFTKLPLPTGVTGPDCIAFDPLGGGPYAGVGDGRILKWQGPGVGFQDFAYTSPNR
ncbi:unnamed protein product [Ilex paraguariensis]|uniref:Uncharacterized protein n=1 Tax=Ilex paraguariensis TaxID=185542 RepID=A0ABC8RSA6_9AQUA